MANEKTLIDFCEPQVRAMAKDLHDLNNSGGKVGGIEAVAPAIFSIAISLRRLADNSDGVRLSEAEQCGQLTRIAEALWRKP